MWNYLVLLPTTILTLYHLPLLVHLTNRRGLIKTHDIDRLKKEMQIDTFLALEAFGLIEFGLDFYKPQDVRFSIRIVN